MRASDQDRADLARRLAELAPSQRVWLGKVVLGMGLLALSSPVELAVPLVRVLARMPGVQTGAAIGSLSSFLLGWAYFTTITRWPGSEDGIDRWLSRPIFSAAVILPGACAVLPGTIILPKRSPLWGWALWLVVRLLASAFLAQEASRLKKRQESNDAPLAVDERP